MLLFLGVLGVITAGFTLDPENPPASVFQFAPGDLGSIFFGIVLFSAALTSVIGCAYTSVSFMRSFHPSIEKYNNLIIIAFILISTLVFGFLAVLVTLIAGWFSLQAITQLWQG